VSLFVDSEEVERERDLRDWFAGLAMQSFIGDKRIEFPLDEDLVSMRAYEVADAMINERDRE
jgi:hypothetical protein